MILMHALRIFTSGRRVRPQKDDVPWLALTGRYLDQVGVPVFVFFSFDWIRVIEFLVLSCRLPRRPGEIDDKDAGVEAVVEERGEGRGERREG